MAGFLTTGETAIMAGLLDSVFQTFQRDIVIWKEPIKTPVPVPSASQAGFGFGDAPVEEQYTYSFVSGVFPAVIRYVKKAGEADLIDGTNSFMPVGSVRIKITQSGHDFIQSGKTDKICFDNQSFYFEGNAQAHPFLGTQYYSYFLKPKI